MIQDLKNDFKNDLCDTFKALYQLAASEYCVTLTVHKHGLDFKEGLDSLSNYINRNAFQASLYMNRRCLQGLVRTPPSEIF